MLPYDPQTEIYKFYEVMKITPVVVEDVLSMLLTIPLIDKSLQMNMYKVHNLPALHTKLGVAAEYILEGDYLAVDEHGLYVALPDAREMPYQSRRSMCNESSFTPSRDCRMVCVCPVHPR